MQLIFILWLDSKGLLGEWIEEVLTCGEETIESILNGHWGQYVCDAFMWDLTESGFKLWEKIDEQWVILAIEIEQLNTK